MSENSAADFIREAIHRAADVAVDEYARKRPAEGQLGLFDEKREKQKKLFSKRPEDEEGRWLTIRGAHVYVSKDDGRILKGPKHFIGKTEEQVHGENGGKGDSRPTPLNELGRIGGAKEGSQQGELFGGKGKGLFDGPEKTPAPKTVEPASPPAEVKGGSDPDDHEAFTLSPPPKPAKKGLDFENNDNSKQGGLFDAGKKGELKGQELLFNSDPGDLNNPKTMENRVQGAPEASSPSPAEKEDGPQEGETNEKGLVFRNGRWHRDGKEIDPAAIVQSAREKNENIWTAAKRELGVQSMVDIPAELRKQLAEAAGSMPPHAPGAGKPEPAPPSPGRQRAMEAQTQKQAEEEKASALPAEKKEAIKKTIEQAVRKRLVQDFGEHIPGARKHNATATGPRPKKDEEQDPRPAWARRYNVGEIVASSSRGEKGKFSVTDEKQKDWFGHPKQLGVYDTKEQAEASIAQHEVRRNHRVRKFNDGTYGITRTVTDRKHPMVKGGFKTYEEAEQYMKENPEEIINHDFPDYETYQYLDSVRREGPDKRKGDIKETDFKDAFNVRGGQFGNWQSGKDGQTSLNHAYDAFHDLADVLGISPEAISLNGDLAMAFGARGTGGKHSARAHYEPDQRIVNLTKMKGAGSLAHEWAHALDYMIGEGEAATEAEYKLKSRPEVKQAIQDVKTAMMTAEREVKTDPGKHAKHVDVAKEAIRQQINNLERAHLPSSYGRKKNPFTKEEQQKWDELKNRLLSGDLGESMTVDTKSTNRFSFGRQTTEVIEEMNKLHKKVTGRSFHTADENSPGNHLKWAVQRLKIAEDNLKKAQESDTAKSRGRSQFYEDSMSLDDKRSKDYYSKPVEMFARAFESYVADKLDEQKRRSDYLIGKGKTDPAKYRPLLDGASPFPEGEERKNINAAFDKLFETIRGVELKSAEKKKSDETPDKYSRTEYLIDWSDSDDESSVEIDHYIHPLVAAGLHQVASHAINQIARPGILRNVMHALAGAAFSAWIAHSAAVAQAQQQQMAPSPVSAGRGVSSAPVNPGQVPTASPSAVAPSPVSPSPSPAGSGQGNQAAPASPASPAPSDPSPSEPGVPDFLSKEELFGEDKDILAAVEQMTESAPSTPSAPGKISTSISRSSKPSSGGSRPLRDPDHPRHPAGAPEGKGGEFAPKNGIESPSSGASESPKPSDQSSPSSSRPKRPLRDPEAEKAPQPSAQLAPDQSAPQKPWEKSGNITLGTPGQVNTVEVDHSQPLHQPSVKSMDQMIQEHLQKHVWAHKTAPEPKVRRNGMQPELDGAPKSPSPSSAEVKEAPKPSPAPPDTSFDTKKLSQNIDENLDAGPAPQESDFEFKNDYEEALQKYNRSAGGKRGALKKRAAKDLIPDIASEHDLDHEDLRKAVEDEIQSLMPFHKRSEEARQYISDMGWDAGRINKAEDRGEDSDSTNWDEVASEWAGQFPEIAGNDESQWVARMWDHAKKGKQKSPSANDEDLVRSVAKRLIDQGYTSSAGRGEDSGKLENPEPVRPVYTGADPDEPTPFHRAAVFDLVDKYVRSLLVSNV